MKKVHLEAQPQPQSSERPPVSCRTSPTSPGKMPVTPTSWEDNFRRKGTEEMPALTLDERTAGEMRCFLDVLRGM